MYTTFCKRGNHAKTPVHGNALLPSFLRVIVDSRIIDCDGVYEACPRTYVLPALADGMSTSNL
ncbi:hypothetical protein M404DRAFT_997865 [Pisolithus tinctorius Marx 270]|uniref:Uncharacterized protein n=1 Tax=Pisolithus tinctorius Marx 270 TaxID=870435 RepID=A0A0C3JF69_PISTI|nr:hypothetical protein M404DRAFT_997865 [Pisolithus tinctorius Marx 270]